MARVRVAQLFKALLLRLGSPLRISVRASMCGRAAVRIGMPDGRARLLLHDDGRLQMLAIREEKTWVRNDKMASFALDFHGLGPGLVRPKTLSNVDVSRRQRFLTTR